jgi:hypothetical protein
VAEEAFSYAGHELSIFAHARVWKSYWASYISAVVARGRILEVGAGIGANTAVLYQPEVSRWTCLEPDRRLADRLRAMIAASPKYAKCDVHCGTIDTLDRGEVFDAILYLDVLEHIESDRAELRRAAAHLDDRGALIILAPAHQWLFSAFDAAIGHFRRYDRHTLTAAIPAGFELERLIYLDSAGLLASAANRYVLGAPHPSHRQIIFWDRVLVRCSVVLDALGWHRIGKSLLGVWRKDATKGTRCAS